MKIVTDGYQLPSLTLGVVIRQNRSGHKGVVDPSYIEGIVIV